VLIMSAEPLYVPDDFGDEADSVWEAERRTKPDPILADPTDPNSDYVPADKTLEKSGIPSRPLVAGRCQKVKKDGTRCRQWNVHGLRYCVAHSGVAHLPNVKELHEQTVHNARLALMKTVPAALTAIDDLITDDDTPPAVRLKASTEVLDRVGVRGGVEIDMHVETEDPGDVLSVRLEQLRTRAIAAREAMEAASAPRVIEGVVVHTNDGQLDLFADEGGAE
jgi:hypothetical protein